ncbi:antitoxin ParD1/3/4 [Algoriphagus ratkowskyi]|uniref:Antitoxin ParD1/3/4 n=1 Tax=Algoriphagus ratkowskyi TaxID=57028 RepID=A0A2W7R4E4_9BACT|nr:type II toxin-antitoxin system ParD family antitoxin [Algoriphagus ratkowskyi]PZX50727.1 antitoxin ParD1/3/4 [Algoriphagus ratkowskyi]TXD75785.1 type II toxin-antitoxin system ParD family antitoxin [Algoriphagus ratkowskyi]
MGTVRKTLTFTDQQDKWIKSQIQAGEFTNESEYVRHLIRTDQARNSKFIELKAAIQEGIDSGVSERTISEIMKEVEERMKADGRL